MKPKYILVIALAALNITAFSQNQTVNLAFTAVDSTDHIQLDSVEIKYHFLINGSLCWVSDTVIYWPDTSISLEIEPDDLLLYISYTTQSTVSVQEVSPEEEQFTLFQNYPNPTRDWSTVSLYIPGNGNVHIAVTDITGRVLLNSDWHLDQGNHSFMFIPGQGNLFILTAKWNGISRSIRIIATGTNNGRRCSLEYAGIHGKKPPLKTSPIMLGIMEESGILDSPDTDTTYTFQFATNIPCPQSPTVEYEGQVYNTVQIFSQCWLKENLNVGMMIPKEQNMTNNGILEKYCYNDVVDSCEKYGGLYEWNEMMQYLTQQDVQGICPPGWHVPTDEEWMVLEALADSQYGIGDDEWRYYEPGTYRGYDAGTNLKTTSGWYNRGNGSDIYGFSGMPGGNLSVIALPHSRDYHYVTGGGYWWSSTIYPWEDGVLDREITSYWPGVFRNYHTNWPGMNDAFSVRCIKGEVYPIELTFTAVNNTSHVQLDSIKVMNRTIGGETMLYWSDTTLLLPVELPFNTGDELLLIGYANSLESGVLDTPKENQLYTFQFATNIPCPGTPTVTYDGQVYNTIQIFSQCWLKENLNVGIMINSNQNQSNNGIIEKYCYNNQPDSCTKYGGLYQCNEMMQYFMKEEGICPPGWHVPADEEWQVLEGAVDSQYGIGDSEWDDEGDRGFNAGTNLKSLNGWFKGGNGSDLFGFTGLPGGYCNYNGIFSNVSLYNLWWTSSSDPSNGFGRRFGYDLLGIRRYIYLSDHGFSVRCLRDD